MPGKTAETKQQLVAGNLSYVRAIAAKVKEQLPREIEFDDLVAYGTQGLIEAADRFDPRHGAAFTTFAYYRVRGAIFDGLRRMGWVPRGEYTRAKAEERAAAWLENLGDHEPAATPRAAGGTPPVEDAVRDLAHALSGVATIFIASLSPAEEESILDPSPQAHERIEGYQAAGNVRSVVASLPPKERRLIEMYYFEEKTLEEAGIALGLSKSWTSRLHARAIDLLQSALMRRDADATVPPPKKRRRANSRR